MRFTRYNEDTPDSYKKAIHELYWRWKAKLRKNKTKRSKKLKTPKHKR